MNDQDDSDHERPAEAPSYRNEIDVLKRHAIGFTKRRPEGGMPVSTFMLANRRFEPVLYLGPKGRRADFAKIAHRLGCGHLGLSPRFEVCDLMRQTLARLSPMGLGFYDLKPFDVAVDRSLIVQTALGFPLGKGSTAWLKPDALVDLVDTFGCGLVFGDFARNTRAR
jgi:hypothetical protein